MFVLMACILLMFTFLNNFAKMFQIISYARLKNKFDAGSYVSEGLSLNTSKQFAVAVL